MTEWQPIETAPKRQYIWLGMSNRMRLGFWVVGKEHENFGTVGGGWIDAAKAEGTGPRGLNFEPTCWHPVPDAPA